VGNYEVNIRKSAIKELDALPAREITKVVVKIRGLAEDPRPPGSEKLTSDEKYRLRQGLYRILYEIDDAQKMVTIVKIAHRREVYR
jgi:mRNA interferase RelE/StbE